MLRFVVGVTACQIAVCATCMDARGIADAELRDTTHRSSLDELINWVQRADRALVFQRSAKNLEIQVSEP